MREADFPIWQKTREAVGIIRKAVKADLEACE